LKTGATSLLPAIPAVVFAHHGACREGLESLGVKPGDSVACIGHTACLNNHYWARLAGVRILTEIYDPETPVYPFLAGLPNRDEVIATVRARALKSWSATSTTLASATPTPPSATGNSSAAPRSMRFH